MIVAAQVRIAAGRNHLEDALVQLQDRHVKRSAAKVIHGDHAILLLVQPIGQRGRRRLIHQPQHLQPGDPSSILGRLPLRVVEVRRHGDHGLRHRPTEEALRVRFSCCST